MNFVCKSRPCLFPSILKVNVQLIVIDSHIFSITKRKQSIGEKLENYFWVSEIDKKKFLQSRVQLMYFSLLQNEYDLDHHQSNFHLITLNGQFLKSCLLFHNLLGFSSISNYSQFNLKFFQNCHETKGERAHVTQKMF